MINYILGVILVIFTAFSRGWRKFEKSNRQKSKQDVNSNNFKFPSNDELFQMSRRSDPLADTVVTVLKKHPRQSDYLSMLRKMAQEHGNEEKETLQKFLSQVDTVPSWVDPEKINAARQFYLKNAFCLMLAGFTAIVESYCYNEGVRVLNMTGRLVANKKEIIRRLYETQQFTNDVMIYGPFPGQKGHDSSVRVRILHAFVRLYIKKSGKWNTATQGAPANQEDTLHTLMLFSHTTLRVCENLGLKISNQEKEDYHHLWRYCGYLMGLEESIFPASYEDEVKLYKLVVNHQRHPDDMCRQIVNKTVEAGACQPPFFFTERFLCSMVRFCLEDQIGLCDQLELPNYGWLHHEILTALSFIIQCATMVQRGFEPLAWVTTALNTIILKWSVLFMLGGRPDFGFKTAQ